MRQLSLSISVIYLIIVPASQSLPAEGTRPLRIVAFGDSTTASRKSVRKVYADRLGEMLRERGIVVEVINAGVPGNTTEHARERFDRDVLGQNPDLAIIQFGINDSAVDVWKNPPATAPRVVRDRYEENLLHFIRSLKRRGAQVILMTPNPLRWSAKTKRLYGKPPYDPGDPNGFEATLPRYREAMRKIAEQEQVPLIDVFGEFVSYAKRQNRSVDDLLLDGMHPNDEGHRIIVELLTERVVEMVGAPATAIREPSV